MAPDIGKFPFGVVHFGFALGDVVKEAVDGFDAFSEEGEFGGLGDEALEFFAFEVGGFAEDEGDDAGFEFWFDVGM